MPRSRRTLAAATAMAACVALSVSASTHAADFLVHNAAEITAAQASAQPGDTITMADGIWANQAITFSDTGTAANPITLRAQTPGRVILTGTSRLTISGDHLVATGLTFRDGTLTSGNVVSFNSQSSFSRFTNSAILDYDATVNDPDGYHWVHVEGQQNRIDHNLFKGHSNAGVTLELSPAVDSRHVVDSNHFVDRPAGSGNGFETIRVGVSGIQERAARALIERNLFERTDGELEIISNKTSENVIRNNTIRASAGTITLRHGQSSTVSGNYFLGENKAGTGGIRVIGPHHVVVNNHLQDLDTNALSITTGYSDWDVDLTATGYEPVYNVLVAHNTAVNVSDQVVTRDAGFNSTPNRTVRPSDVKMVNNLLYSTHETLIQGTEGTGWTWAGNIASGTTVGKTDPGIANVNPQLAQDAKGIWRPVVGSPAINGGATGPWALPTSDIDGQGRLAPFDVGADEVNAAAGAGGPLSASDVGPSWLKRRSMAVGTTGVPIILFEAEDFTARQDPNGANGTWTAVASSGSSGGFVLKAPGGARTDLPGTHDAIVEFDVAFHDPGTYFLYVLARGATSSSDSLYSPATLGASPTVNESLPTGTFGWRELATYTISAADVNRPLTLQLGKREGNAEIDMLLFSPIQLNLPAQIPEPAGVGILVVALSLFRRPTKTTRTRGWQRDNVMR